MSMSIYQISVPVYLRFLGSLSKILAKAAAHAEAKKIDPSVLLASRLYPDMLPLTRQVQMTADHAKGASARLAGLEIPSFADTETTFADLQARIAKTVEFLQSIKPEQMEGAEDKQIELKLSTRTLNFSGQIYLMHFSMPNFLFHATTAYDILRHNGVELGKVDFMGA